MKTLCNTCNLRNDIEKYRIMLNNLIAEKDYKLLDEEIINLSKYLDELVYKCVFCNKSLEYISKLNLKNVFGIHSTFYYYGYQHLFTSLYFYITAGIDNNELIYVSMEKSLYNKLLDFLKINEVPVEHIKFNSVEELIKGNTYGGLTELKNRINKALLSNEVKKYSGIRWIGQPSYAIKSTSQNDFLVFETNLTKGVYNTKASILCIYDAYDYMNKGECINEIVIKKSLLTHSYILKDSFLEKIG